MARTAAAQVLLVLVTCPNRRLARRLAERAVSARAAACVNVLPGIDSVFRWEGAIDRARETLLLIKTTKRAYARLERVIAAAHPYDVPEIIALPLRAGLPAYLNWVGASVR